MFETPTANDDTQPTQATISRPLLPTWMLMLLMLSTLVTLALTLRWLWQPSDQPLDTAPLPRQITLVQDSGTRTLTTTRATVGDVLDAQGISVQADDAISVPLDALVRDGMTITIARARTVQLTIDDTQQTIRTPLSNPRAILDAQNITLNAHDRIWLDGTATDRALLAEWPVPVNEIDIQRGLIVTIIDGETEITQRTTADTVGTALFEADVTLYLTDIVTPDVNTPLRDDMRIVIDRAQPLQIQVDGTTIDTRVQGTTVADALAETGIALVGLDYVVPAESDPVHADMMIQVVRVTEAVASYTEELPYETIMQADPDLALDQRRVLQAGQRGIRRYDERVRYENGEEIAREPAGTTLVQAPQNEIVGYGTQIVLRTIQTPDGPRQYWRRLRVYATSYKPESVGGSTTTAIGMYLEKGIIGADPTIIPYRTNMFVPGYGVGVMADTGGPRSSRYWIDLGYSDADWVSWSQYVDVYLLTPVPENINYLLPQWRPMAGLPDNG